MNDEKLWLIEAGDVLEVMTPDKKQPNSVQVENVPPPAPRPRPQVAAAAPRIQPQTAVAGTTETARRRKKPTPVAKSKLHFAPLVALTYLLGPLAIMLTPAGRRSKFMVALAGLAVGATAVLVTLGFGGLVDGARPVSAWAWLGLVTLAVGGGFTVWARALHLVGGEGIPHVNKLPYWVRRSWMISGLGLVAPGSGLLLGGKPGRAALTLWSAWPVVAAAIILLHGLGLWRHHQAAGWLADSGLVIERGLMLAAAIVAAGFLGYVAQALEGMRQVMIEPGLKTRVKGDYYAAAVMVFAVALVVAANPARMAAQIDTGGDILHAEGFRAIPLEMTLVASHLDPAKVEYSLQAMNLYTELGATEKAEAMRNDLDANLGTYVALVQREAVSEFSLARARPQTRPAARAAAADTPVRRGPGSAATSGETNLVGTTRAGKDRTVPTGQANEALSVGLDAVWYLGAMYDKSSAAGDGAMAPAKDTRSSAADSAAPGK